MSTVIITIAPLIGVVYCSPLKKASILSATPKKAGATNFEKSPRPIFFAWGKNAKQPKKQSSANDS